MKALVRRIREGLAALLRAPRRLRGGPRQRRRDPGLGRAGPRRDRPAQRPRRVRRVLREVRRGGPAGALPRRPGDRRVPARHPPRRSKRSTVSTSTRSPTARPPPASRCRSPGPRTNGLVLVDATSAAGSLPVDPEQFDVYYGSPQKGFASEGGLFLALLHRGRSSDSSRSTATSPPRWTCASRWRTAAWTRPTTPPRSPRCTSWPTAWTGSPPRAVWTRSPSRSPRSPTCSTPGPRTARSRRRSSATPRSAAPWSARSTSTVSTRTRSRRPCEPTAIVDVEAYRKLGRNQLRIAVFPAVDHADVEALLACLDWLVHRLVT